MHLLEMNHIRKVFPGVVALEDVSIKLDKGEVLALLGENGAGKSTLIKVLAGVHVCDAGDVIIEGEHFHLKEPKQALDAGIAVIYQELCLAQDMTVAENIFIGREKKTRLGLLDSNAMNSAAAEILAGLGMDIPPTVTLRQLSIAQKQVIEIAKCISTNAKIIVMDEPTSSLTDEEVKILFQLIGKLKSQGIGIIYISHRMDEIFSICDRVTVIRDGKSVGDRTISGTTREELIALMMGRTLEQYYVKDDHVQEEVVLEATDYVTAYSPANKISFSLHKGEILGFSGLVGAGRSELMRAIFGVDKKLGGSLKLFGKDVAISSPQDAIENGLAMVSEDRKKEGLILLNDIEFNTSILCLKEFISFCRVNKKKEREIVDEQIEAMSIKVSGHKQLAVNLSGGNQQKVVLGKWLARHPRIIIMDEPTRGIDVKAKAEIYTIMNNLTAQGCSIIMISSELPEILGMCDRVVVMMEGRVTGTLDRSELSQERIMKYSLNTGI